MITARILADSINPNGKRLTSWLLTYPRFIHAEFMTHRQFSRSAASSRAIPFKRMAQDVGEKPALPEWWGSEQKGMASGDALGDFDKEVIHLGWMDSRDCCLRNAKEMHATGLHKSVANRILEPWAHITVLATATDHSNFFNLRAHPAAQPEFQVLAYRMLAAYIASTPNFCEWGEWHVPQFDGEDYRGYRADGRMTDTSLKIAVARCARLSYKTHDGQHSEAADLELYSRLFGPPIHAGAMEHVAQAVEVGCLAKFRRYPWSNFDIMGAGPDGRSGWGQYRKLFDGECVRTLDADGLANILARKPEWITV